MSTMWINELFSLDEKDKKESSDNKPSFLFGCKGIPTKFSDLSKYAKVYNGNRWKPKRDHIPRL